MKAPVRIYARRNRRRGIWKKFVSMVACIVVFVTTYALLLPAITMEKTALCGLEDHQHDDSCFEEQLICGLEETEGHRHTDACYTTRLDLICEKTPHSHTRECFDSEGNLLCALEEHAHQTGCCDEDGNFICTLEEHTHTKECFDNDGTLTCALGEHAHNSGCFTVDRHLACGQEEIEPHHHTDACYEKVLVCGKEPHTHSAECYAEKEAPSVDNAVADAGKGDFTDDNSAGESGAETSTGDVVAGEQVSDGSEAADGIAEAEGEDAVADSGSENAVETAAADADEQKTVFYQGIADTLTFDGPDYTVTASYTEDAGIPAGASLVVSEITEEEKSCETYREQAEEAVGSQSAVSSIAADDAELEVRELLPTGAAATADTDAAETVFDAYVSKTENALGMAEGSVSYIRLFDIKIVDREGEKIEIAAPVDVRIDLADKSIEEEAASDIQIVHFADESGSCNVIENVNTELAQGKEAGMTLTFAAESFSVYAVVTAKDLPAVSDISELAGYEFYLSIDNNNARYYFKNTISSSNSTQIAKTDVADIGNAALYGFEKIEGSENKYYLYTHGVGGEKIYVNMNNNGYMSFGDDPSTLFTVEKNDAGGEDAFYIYYTNTSNKKMALYWNSAGFSGKNESSDRTRIILTKPYGNDPFDLEGKSYGIINNQNTVSGTALMTGASNSNTRLSGKTMTVRTEPIRRTENVFVANDSQIAMWSFRAVSGNQYQITAEVNGSLKYLRIDASAVTLVDEPDGNCVITVEPGTGIYSGKYKFSCNGSALHLNGTTFDRKTDLTTTNDANCWMNLAELSNLKDDDFVVYTADKVSVSGTVREDGSIDYDVQDGGQVILYTRIWNKDTLRYDYYAIDYDGMLIKAYESGGTISWVGSKINTMLWDFTEYHYLDENGEDTGIPSYYYELQNAYSGKYIAPQVSGTDFLSDSTAGINLNGRRNGEYYTTVLAWDDPYYDYASLKVQEWQLTSALITKADTFYFAVMKPEETEDKLTTVATIDSKPFGITLKMQDYDGYTNSGDYRCPQQTNVIGAPGYNQYNGTADLLSKNLGDDGYPIALNTGKSLYELYNEAIEVNHQFLLSTYQETGYFEYDSTQNFAHLITSTSDKWYGQQRPGGGTYEVGDFVIYEQIASTNESTGVTRQHGQFFPYNDLTEGSYISNMKNTTDIHGDPLSSLDPRNGENLYLLKYKKANTAPDYVDHFFGMEMTASFMQSANGRDAWGHDLIFEFSGDDDFWLYVDDMLVLDLGGVHQALDGSVNFRTGEVGVWKNQKYQSTNLRNLYKAAYTTAHTDAADSEVEAWLDSIFKENDDGIKTVFKDYSGHTMKMYFMERGAGASNLHMRFNLAPYKDGEVLLEKKISGTENIDPDTVFPFQIQYHEKDWPDKVYQYVTDTEADMGPVSVTDYRDENVHIPFYSSYTVGNTAYENVFLLKPGQTVSIWLPAEDTDYFITECGMDTSVYDIVQANDVPLAGTPAGPAQKTRDFAIAPATVAGRKKVIYDNHVSDDAQHSLTITKKLWEDDGKERPITEDAARFRFRICIGKEGEEYTVYSTGKYYVKDPDGSYCTYSAGSFQSTGKNRISDFDAENGTDTGKSDLEQITFHTSPSGIADRIPAGYTVEIPGLMDGAPFFVEEREDEIPAGYHLIDYERKGSDIPEGETANSGIIDGEDEGIIINNQHGYGLTVNKVWSDADFMDDHDEIYFAVYRNDGDTPVLLTETLRSALNGRPAPSVDAARYASLLRLDSANSFVANCAVNSAIAPKRRRHKFGKIGSAQVKIGRTKAAFNVVSYSARLISHL